MISSSCTDMDACARKRAPLAHANTFLVTLRASCAGESAHGGGASAPSTTAVPDSTLQGQMSSFSCSFSAASYSDYGELGGARTPTDVMSHSIATDGARQSSTGIVRSARSAGCVGWANRAHGRVLRGRQYIQQALQRGHLV